LPDVHREAAVLSYTATTIYEVPICLMPVSLYVKSLQFHTRYIKKIVR